MEESEILPFEKKRRDGAIGALRPYFETLAMVAASTLLGLLVEPLWTSSPVDLLYLPAVLAAAGLFGLWPGVVAAVASALAYNFYFTHPIHTFRINSPADIATVALLFLVALVTSQLAARMRSAARTADASARRNATIAGLARRLLGCTGEDQIAQTACRDLGRLFDCNTVLMVAGDPPRAVAARPGYASLTPTDLAAGAWAIEAGKPVGRGAEAVNATEWLFHPIRSDSAVLGALGLARDDGTLAVGPSQRQLLESLVDQVALALERARLEAEAREFETTRERDRVRSTLLSTIGQDLDPRLTAISEAANGLLRTGSGDRTLTSAISSHAAKLRRYLDNLLELGSEADERPVEAGGVSIDLFNRVVHKDGASVHLAPKEYAVLAELAKHHGRVLSHAHLLRTAWGPAHENQAEYLRVAIRALRQKLEVDPKHPALIVNEPAVGYRLVAQDGN